MKRYKHLALACLLTPQAQAMTQSQGESLPPLTDILQQEYGCSDTLVIRAQALTQTRLSQACQLMLQQERRFHRLLDTHDTPVPQCLRTIISGCAPMCIIAVAIMNAM
ncbi:collagenase [Shewanella salipaludis]|uniref:collagenase n=1 Tax=Shewanella salipaludis TaxID=2723052 RepID=UPI00313FE2E7